MKPDRWPRLIANFAVTADGKISTRNRTPSGFTSAEDKRRLLEIRALGDALIVGRGTVAADTMSMRLRDRALAAERVARGQDREPLRVIVSNRGRFDEGWKVFAPGGAERVLAVPGGLSGRRSAALGRLGTVLPVGGDRVDLGELLAVLRGRFGVRAAVCEGGASLFRGFAEIGAVDELYLTVAPVVFGGAGAPTITGVGLEFLPVARRARIVSMETRGDECYLHYRFRKREKPC